MTVEFIFNFLQKNIIGSAGQQASRSLVKSILKVAFWKKNKGNKCASSYWFTAGVKPWEKWFGTKVWVCEGNRKSGTIQMKATEQYCTRWF